MCQFIDSNLIFLDAYLQIAIDSDMNDFFKRISRELIPKDLGGTLPYTRDELNSKLLQLIILKLFK